MRKIIAGLDLGSDTIKLVVGEILNGHLNILCATKTPVKGIKNGKIENNDLVIESIKKAVKTVNQSLGLEIKKVILGINGKDANLIKSATAIKIEKENNVIGGDDISKICEKCSTGKVAESDVLVATIPVEFTLDDDIKDNNPLGKRSENLGLKAILVTSPKDYVKTLLNIVTEAGLKVMDVVPNTIGDYYMFKTENTDKLVGSVINIGHENTTISIFNKGILTNTHTYLVGAKTVVNDISFINKLDDKASLGLYKDLVLASSKLANPKEYRLVTNVDGKEVKLSQYDLSQIAEERINEILELAKKEINILTKKQISYIIITGGLTELRDFNIVATREFGKNVKIGNIRLIGARDNSYSSVLGIIKYFSQKLDLRGKNYSIVNDDDFINCIEQDSKEENESILGKVFGYFFDN